MRRWFALLLLGVALSATLVLLTCTKSQPSPSHPPVSYDEGSGTVFIPNATIVTGGTEYSETAPLSDSGLALVITEDSSVYFYSTRIGNVDSMSIEHSCEAIGYFLMANSNAGCQGTEDFDVELESGVKLRTVPGDKVECANTLHRWAAVKVNPNGGSVLLTPRSCFKVGLIDLFEGDFSNVLKFNRIPRDTVAAGTLYETYGGVARMFICQFSAQLLMRQGEAIKAGFGSDPEAFTCLQILDGCDIIWLVVDAVSPVGAGSLAEVFGKTLFKAAVKADVQGVLANAVAPGSAPEIVADVVARGVVDEIINDVITGLVGGAVRADSGDCDVRAPSPAKMPTPRVGLTSLHTTGQDVRVAVEPVTVCLLILKAIKVAVAGTNLIWGVYDAATHDAYATYVDSTGGGEMVLNGGFESDFAHWGSGGSFEVIDSSPHSGLKCARSPFASAGYYDGGLSSDHYLSLQQGRTYRFSIWVRENGTHDTYDPTKTIFDIGVYINGASYAILGDSGSPSPSQNWHLVERSFTPTDTDTAAYISIQIHGYATIPNAFADVDDVSIVEVSEE